MRQLQWTTTVMLGAIACVELPVSQSPRGDRIPTGLQIEGLGRVAINEPLRVSGAVLASDSAPPGFRISPIDDWYRLPVTATSGYEEVWVWVRRGTVGCLVALYAPATRHEPTLAQAETRLGPPLRVDSVSNPVARWMVWGDRRAVWSLVGPQPGHQAAVAISVAARDPRQNPIDASYFSPCTSARIHSPGAG